MVQNTEAPTVLVAGKYRLTRLLGRGGMGSVWEGVHTTLGTRVAVKFIETEYAESPEARNRFENEARAAATLRSKHVVEVYDHGLGSDGRPFIVMEYLEGEPLDRRLDRLGRLPAKDTARILQQVCRALGKAHTAGIVHRDLKPENIFLVWDDEDGADIAKVVDFGIAKFTDRALSPSSATRTGSVLGTPYYMSPEQARGLRSVDHRSDLWSLGIIAFRCIVGRLPFEGEAIGDLLVKICTSPVPLASSLVSDAPPAFDAFIARALAREPEARFQTAQEFAESLAVVCGVSVRGPYAPGELSGRPSHPSPVYGAATPMSGVQVTASPLTQTPAPKAPSRASLGGVVAAIIVALVVVGIGVALLLKKDPPPSALDAQPTGDSAAAPPMEGDPPQVTQLPVTQPEDLPVVAPAPVASDPPPAPSARAPQRQVAPQRRAPARPTPVVRAPEPKPEPKVERTNERSAPAPAPPQPRPVPARKEIDVGY